MKKVLILLVVVLSFYNSLTGKAVDITHIAKLTNKLVCYESKYYVHNFYGTELISKIEYIYLDKPMNEEQAVINYMLSNGWDYMDKDTEL
jgi:hypothetical protein